MNSFEMHTEWIATERTLYTRFTGVPDAKDVVAWKHDLFAAVNPLPENTAFKIFIDISGYSVDEVPREVHFEQRLIIPEFLAAHDFKIGYLKMYAEPITLLTGPENRRCIAAAHVHHECFKMDFYREKFGGPTDGYFCDRAQARQWLREI